MTDLTDEFDENEVQMCNSYMIIIYTFLSLHLIISYLRPLQISVFSFCNFHFLIVDIRNIEALLLLYIDLIIPRLA